MNLFRMPPQVVRLVLLTIAIVGSYIVARYFLTPSSFGEHGWYRGHALIELASLPTEFGGRQSCIECHDTQGETLAKGGHRTVSCEACHGSLAWHAEDPLSGRLSKDEVISDCLRCHAANPSRPPAHKQIVAREHYSGEKCSECHAPHTPMESQ
jgi:hypothetical protein